jgi:hypothetical protein
MECHRNERVSGCATLSEESSKTACEGPRRRGGWSRPVSTNCADGLHR